MCLLYYVRLLGGENQKPMSRRFSLRLIFVGVVVGVSWRFSASLAPGCLAND